MNVPLPSQKGIRQKQIQFSRKLATILPLNVVNEVVNDEMPPYETNVSSYIEFGKEEASVENLKVLLKNGFFAPILKRESDSTSDFGVHRREWKNLK